MKNNFDFTKKGLFLTEDVCWKSKVLPSIELLSEKDKITEVVTENLDNLNKCLLIKNYPFCNSYNGTLTFGIQLNLDSVINCTSIQTLNNLQSDKVRYSQFYKQYHYSGLDNFPYKIISTFHFEDSEVNEIIEKFSDAAKSTSMVFLQLGKNSALLMLEGSDLYELKNSSKLFRKEDSSYEEYFFQQNDDCPVFNKILSLEEGELLNDDAHRVIFDK